VSGNKRPRFEVTKEMLRKGAAMRACVERSESDSAAPVFEVGRALADSARPMFGLQEPPERHESPAPHHEQRRPKADLD
jgi:hypothetical protein